MATKTPPVKIGDIITGTIDRMGAKDPIMDYAGFVIFVKRLPEERKNSVIKARVTGVKASYGFANYEEESP